MIHRVRIVKANGNSFPTVLSSTNEMILDKKKSEYLLDDDGISIDNISVTHSTYSANSIPGEVVEAISYGKGRNITITGWIVDEPSGSLSLKKTRLNSFYSPEVLYRLEFGDRYIDAYPKAPVSFGAKYKDNNDKFCKFVISFFAPYPFFKSKQSIRIYPIVTPVSPLTDSDMENPEAIDGIVAPNGYTTSFSMQMAEIENPSDVAVGFKMRVKLAPPSSVSYHAGIKVHNVTTSEYFLVQDSVLNGVYELSTIPGNRYFRVVGGSSALSGYDSGSNFFMLKPGKSTIALRFPYYPSIAPPPQQYMWIKSLYFELTPEYFYVEDEVY